MGWRLAEEWVMGVARIALAKGCCIEVGCLDMSAHGLHQRDPDSGPHFQQAFV